MNGNTELLKIYSQEETSKASQLIPTLESYLRTDSVTNTYHGFAPLTALIPTSEYLNEL